MKRLTLIGLVLLVAGLFYSFSPSEEYFSGKIVFDVKYENLPAGAEAYSSMMPNKATYHIDKTRTRIEMEPSGMFSNVMIMDYEAKKMRTLMNIMGKKIQMVGDAEFAQSFNNDQTTEIKYSTDTKTIAGYECKKAIIKSEEGAVTIWTTDKINGYHAGGQFKGLKGYPLEFSTSQQGMTIAFTATKVEPGKVDAKLFEIPKDYQETTPEQMQQMFQGR